uniref:Uncharacterized protein n=1 Tax=Chromera velia CCMP2878 TaxID=1169474 RepID=A0A0G4H6N9_9ALVE|eukprot:Cvel_24879.t1-p1 / transcript=Cvel_24879.t1 / gene=Cvel_24879 / organism=Chromera_velia_CCMP2878 / gene_product=hypothetical protein / transcript_product=hypothetical protein / location=Cvel_scaffold2749:19870-22979(+) / protein_length=226 / sequence_SO=supercontig / SO=protein_coding / is_pseudo=false
MVGCMKRWWCFKIDAVCLLLTMKKKMQSAVAVEEGSTLAGLESDRSEGESDAGASETEEVQDGSVTAGAKTLIATLQQQQEEQRASQKLVEERTARLQAENDELKDTAQKARKECASYKAANERVKISNRKTEDNLKESNKECARLRAQSESLQKEIEKAKAEMAELRVKFQTSDATLKEKEKALQQKDEASQLQHEAFSVKQKADAEVRFSLVERVEGAEEQLKK